MRKYAVDIMTETEDKYILETKLFRSSRKANEFYRASKALDNGKRNTEMPFIIQN